MTRYRKTTIVLAMMIVLATVPSFALHSISDRVSIFIMFLIFLGSGFMIGLEHND